MDSVVLESVRTDVNSTLVLFRTIHGTLNSVLSRVGSLSDTLRQNTTLLDDCAQVEQSLSSLQHRLNGNEHNACSINGTTAPTTPSATRIAACETTVTALPTTFASVVATPPPAKQVTVSNHHEPDLCETINITIRLLHDEAKAHIRKRTTTIQALKLFVEKTLCRISSAI